MLFPQIFFRQQKPSKNTGWYPESSVIQEIFTWSKFWRTTNCFNRKFLRSNKQIIFQVSEIIFQATIIHSVKNEGWIYEHLWHSQRTFNAFDKYQIYTLHPQNNYHTDFCNMNLPKLLVSPRKHTSANVITVLSPIRSPRTCLTSYESDHLLLFLT